MKKIVITFGLISGLIIATLMLLSISFTQELQDYDLAQLVGFGSMILALSTIFFAIKAYRDKHNNGTIKFGKAFLLGLYITLIASAVHTVSWSFYMSFGKGKEVMESYFEAQVEQLKSKGLSEDELQKELEKAESDKQFYMNPWFHYPIVFLTEVPSMGVPISLICALILKRKEES